MIAFVICRNVFIEKEQEFTMWHSGPSECLSLLSMHSVRAHAHTGICVHTHPYMMHTHVHAHTHDAHMHARHT